MSALTLTSKRRRMVKCVTHVMFIIRCDLSVQSSGTVNPLSSSNLRENTNLSCDSRFDFVAVIGL